MRVWTIPIALATALTVGGTAAQPRPAAPPPRELTADQQVQQALNRLAFGPRPGDAERVRAVGVDRWIDQQLHPERIADPATETFVAAYPVLTQSPAELLREFPPPGVVLAQRRLQAGMPGAGGAAAAMATVTADDSAKIRAAGRESYRVVGELQTAKVGRAVASERQLQEVMVDFWENHFNVFAGKDRVRYALPAYDAMIRAHAFGKFRDLLGAVAHSDAMLQYLDNFQSIADSTHRTLRPARGLATGARRLAPGTTVRRRPRPGAAPDMGAMTADSAGGAGQLLRQLAARRPRGLNENYARELMELHTLGVDGGYTQADVVEVARALTGWSIKAPAAGGGFVFRPEAHDADPKVVLGHRLAAGRGVEDGEEVLDLVARHPSTARYIATKLARRFVADSPSTALVDRAAATFTRTDGDIRETLRTILTSPEFFSQRAYRAKVKSPFELVVSAARALGGTPDATPRTAQLVGRLGQPIFGHADPNGYPETGAAWMNTGAILNRINFGLLVAANRLPGARLADWPTAATLARAPREQQVDGVVSALLGGAASPDTRQVLLSGQNPLLGSAKARQSRDSLDAPDPTMAADDRRMGRRAARQAENPAAAAREAVKPGRAQPVVGQLPPLNGFAQIVGLALGAPEFQRH